MRVTQRARKARWFAGKRPVFQFVGLFILLMTCFYILVRQPFMDKGLLLRYMALNAEVSAIILNVFGEGARASGTLVSSPRYNVDIKRGCDAIEPSALFVAAVLAFPSSIVSKLPGILLGTIVLAVLNLLRIITLFYTGIHFPRLFDIMHEDVWQALFILVALFLWVIWALWATKRKSVRAHAAQ